MPDFTLIIVVATWISTDVLRDVVALAVFGCFLSVSWWLTLYIAEDGCFAGLLLSWFDFTTVTTFCKKM